MTEHEPHYTAIGRMLVEFQCMEAVLTQGLLLLMNSELGTPSGQLAHATISELSFSSASRLAGLLPSIFTAERIGSSSPEGANRLREELDDCANKLTQGLKLANDAEQRRNQLVHSVWFIGPGPVNPPGTLIRTKTKVKARNLSIQFELETVHDIDKNTEKAKEALQLIGTALRNYRLISNFKW